MNAFFIHVAKSNKPIGYLSQAVGCSSQDAVITLQSLVCRHRCSSVSSSNAITNGFNPAFPSYLLFVWKQDKPIGSISQAVSFSRQPQDCSSKFRLLPLRTVGTAATASETAPTTQSDTPGNPNATNQSDSSVKRLSATAAMQHHRESMPAEKPEQSNLVKSSHR